MDGAYYAQLSELVVDEGVAAWDKVTVSWKAPHENGAIGGATQQYIMSRHEVA